MAYHTLKGKGYPSVSFLNARLDIDAGKIDITK
jgi:hypothetical protein